MSKYFTIYRRESRRRSTLSVPRRQSVVSRRSSVGIDDRHLSTVTTSNNVEEILKAEGLPKINTFRIFSTNAKEWHYILMGSLASVVMGASMPVYAFLFGEVCDRCLKIGKHFVFSNLYFIQT